MQSRTGTYLYPSLRLTRRQGNSEVSDARRNTPLSQRAHHRLRERANHQYRAAGRHSHWLGSSLLPLQIHAEGGGIYSAQKPHHLGRRPHKRQAHARYRATVAGNGRTLAHPRPLRRDSRLGGLAFGYHVAVYRMGRRARRHYLYRQSVSGLPAPPRPQGQFFV